MIEKYLIYILVMALSTYLVRMLPMAIFQKKIQSVFVKSFLQYVPYAVLSAMTIPAVFTASGHLISSLIGFAVAMVLAFYRKSLIVVALCASGAAVVAELGLLILA